MKRFVEIALSQYGRFSLLNFQERTNKRIKTTAG